MEDRQVVVIGAGPAGLSAAIEIRKKGGQVTLIDENSRPGGQLFKQIHRFFGSREHKAGVRGFVIGQELLKEVEQSGVEVWLDSVVYGIFPDKVLGVVTGGRNRVVRAKAIIVATGAQENPLSFPGWTLPGVMGAGACQTMMNIHRVLPGKRVLMVGSGNVGLIVSFQLLQAGAQVLAVLDILPKIGGYLVHAAKLARFGVPVWTSHTVLEAGGNGEVQKAVISPVDEKFTPVKGKEKELKVDLVCLAVGLSPLAELLEQAGCAFTCQSFLGGNVVLHDENMRTTVPGIYVSGDASGIEEASTAMEEGRLAGVTCAEDLNLGAWPEEKQSIRRRLDDFRIGSFGAERKKAKEKIFSEFYEEKPVF
jgi:NADPH-dependent 2,4-dienoyl-CoA reductase/sulfur reductase-like enzyme